MNESEPKKAKRGRPSNKKISNLPIRGIIKEPSNFNTAECEEFINFMEFTYDNPSVLTRVFRLFKQYKCEIIRFVFEPEHIYIYSKDHIMKNTIFMDIDCHLMNSYYLKSPLIMNLDAKIIYQIMRSVDTNHDYISFSTSNDNFNRMVKITLIDSTTGEEGSDNIEINTIDAEDNMWDKLWTDLSKEEEYPLFFEFTHKKFKNYVNKWDSLAYDHTIRFVKAPGGTLSAQCPRRDGRGNHSMVYTNNDYINLVDNCEELFDVGIKLDFIRSYATSLIGNIVKISIDNTLPMILTSNVDLCESENNKPRFKVKVISDLE